MKKYMKKYLLLSFLELEIRKLSCIVLLSISVLKNTFLVYSHVPLVKIGVLYNEKAIKYACIKMFVIYMLDCVYILIQVSL